MLILCSEEHTISIFYISPLYILKNKCRAKDNQCFEKTRDLFTNYMQSFSSFCFVEIVCVGHQNIITQKEKTMAIFRLKISALSGYFSVF